MADSMKVDPVEAVPLWAMHNGVGHAVRRRDFGMPAVVYCGAEGLGAGGFTPLTPRRICRECRSRINHWSAFGGLGARPFDPAADKVQRELTFGGDRSEAD